VQFDFPTFNGGGASNTGVDLGGDCAIFIVPAGNPPVLKTPNAPHQPALPPGAVLAAPNARAYYELSNTGMPLYTFNNTYQILSAGSDGVFGSGGTVGGGVLWSSSAGATGPGRDDQANFASSILSAGQ
jgi:hypothetical protein